MLYEFLEDHHNAISYVRLCHEDYADLHGRFIFWRRAFIALLIACMIGVAGVAFAQETGRGDTEVLKEGD